MLGELQRGPLLSISRTMFWSIPITPERSRGTAFVVKPSENLRLSSQNAWSQSQQPRPFVALMDVTAPGGIEIAQRRDHGFSRFRIGRHRTDDPGDRSRVIGIDQNVVLDIQQRTALQLSG